MSDRPVAVRSTGLVTSVGLSALASCAAIRAKISNPSETRFLGNDGEWIMAHQVALDKPWRGRARLSKMVAMAIDECLLAVPAAHWATIPLLLCVAEADRPGRLEGLDEQLLRDIEQDLCVRFSSDSATIAHGRVGATLALMHARELVYGRGVDQVLIAATDSLLTWPSLSYYARNDRLLAARNSNGFMPGEAAAALLVGRRTGQTQLVCSGFGLGMERAHINSGDPLRGQALTQALKAALTEAGCAMHDIDFRITDLSGEQYYFKEANLALNRLLRVRREESELWHPAECTGSAGSALGIICLAVAQIAATKGYAPGRRVMLHAGNDDGRRAAIVGTLE